MTLSDDTNLEVPVPIMTDVQDIASMIQVNEGATVSRTVMHCEGMRLVLFSFDKDVILRPGGVIHFGTRLPHAVRALEPSKLALFMLDSRERAPKK